MKAKSRTAEVLQKAQDVLDEQLDMMIGSGRTLKPEALASVVKAISTLAEVELKLRAPIKPKDLHDMSDEVLDGVIARLREQGVS